jgi:cell division septation protein DedD
MASLRALLILLILLNLLAFAALRGWLGSPATRGEPERLTNQLNPERIKLRPPPSAARSETSRAKASAPVQAEAAPAQPAAPAAASEACMAFAPLSSEAARGLGDTLAAQAGLKIRDVPTELPNSWWVSLPPAESKEGAEARVAELRKQGVTDFFIVQEPGPNQFAVSLGLFKQESQAERLAEQLRGKGVQARVSPRGTPTHRVEIRGPADRLAALSGEIKARHPAANRAECQP